MEAIQNYDFVGFFDSEIVLAGEFEVPLSRAGLHLKPT
jgi:hypothetical protein